MKTLIIAIFSSIAVLLSGRGQDGIDEGKVCVDRQLLERATVVVRAKVNSPGEGSKYHWAEVTKLATFKAPEGIKIANTFEVAYQSVGDPLPMGVSTLYLVPYNPDKPEFGWKLLQDFDSKTSKYRGGYSHHSPEKKAEPKRADQPLPTPQACLP